MSEVYVSFKSGGHDPSMAILIDGKIVAAAEEERFVRKKHARGHLPINAINWGLKKFGLKPSDVDCWIVTHVHPLVMPFVWIRAYLVPRPKNLTEIRYCLIRLKHTIIFVKRFFLRSLPYQLLLKELGIKHAKVKFLEHHLAHSYSSFLFSPFLTTLSISIDGKGDETSILIGEVKSPGGEIKPLKRFDARFSLGLAFASLTKFLGFEPNDGEYKVMGLAPYGKPVIDLSPIFGISREGNVTRSFLPFIFNWKNSRHLQKFLGVEERTPESEIEPFHADLAASAQSTLESSMLNFIRHLRAKYSSSNLCLSGGVALNVKMNKRIRDEVGLSGIYVQPVSSDSGLPLGGVAWEWYQNSKSKPEPLNSLHLGPDIEEFDIIDAIESYGYRFEVLDKVVNQTATLLSEGAIIGWMQGRMELGPRALGARSILADPRTIQNRDMVNEKIKFREMFRPFCPSMLEEDFVRYCRTPKDAPNSLGKPFMIETFETTPEAAREIPAVVHIDYTTRPQVLGNTNWEASEFKYYSLLRSFKNITGVGVLLNTSFNRRGEPIACSPKDGLEIFRNTALDYLVIGNFLVHRD